jgi:hypothetical protein
MNVDEALRRFADETAFPREALQWSLDNWDEASPRFIAKLRACAVTAASDRDPLFSIVHLCGEKRESRAYTPICDLIANDATIDEWLGDGVTANLNGILINVCDGDVEPLRRAIESETGDEYARGAALEALAYLVRAKQVLTDDEMRDYLQRLGETMQPRQQSWVWWAWTSAIAMLGYEALRADVARVFSRGWIERQIATLDNFHQDLQQARRDADGMAAFEAAQIRPFGSTIETLEAWSSGAAGPNDELAEPGRYEPEAPYVNPLREIGRNDPCPCGSGKKFKKCCLAP